MEACRACDAGLGVASRRPDKDREHDSSKCGLAVGRAREDWMRRNMEAEEE